MATDVTVDHTATAAQEGAANRRRWWALIVIALAQLMVVLDATIVNVALPTISRELSVSAADQQWVVTAYTLAFGGLLLLGGRISDYTGRKRAFVIGLIGFAAASAIGGASVNLAMLLIARAGQGAFGALLAPSALALLTTTFRDPRERGTAFAVFGAVAGGGTAVGLVLGGVLTEYLSWGWVLYVNAPVAVVAAIGAYFFLSESRTTQAGRFDLVGAALVTAGLGALVYGFSGAVTHGWGSFRTLALVIGGVVILVVFVIVERFRTDPLLPLRIVLNRGRGGAALTILLATVGMFGAFFFLSFYVQAILGYSPVRAGLAFLPLTGGVLFTSAIASQVMTRVPPRLLLGIGLTIAAGGMAWLIQLEVGSGYVEHVLPGLIAIGMGLGAVFPTASNLATSGVAASESGVASATLNTSQQVGATLGTSLLNTVAANRTADYLASHRPGQGVQLVGLVEGYTRAVTWGAIILASAAIVSVFLVNARLGPSASPATAEPEGEMPAEASDGSSGSLDHPDRLVGSPLVADQAIGTTAAVGRTAAGPVQELQGRHLMASTDAEAEPRQQIRGTVRRVDGAGISGAVVTLIEIGGDQVGEAAISESVGRFQIDPPRPGDYLLIVAAGGHRPRAKTVNVRSDLVTVDLTLEGSTDLSGIVTAADGKPINEATVTLADLRGHVVATSITDPGGAYNVSELAAATYTLVVAARGYRADARAISVAAAGSSHQDVVLSGITQLEGIVRSATSQHPIAEARVTLLDEEGTVIAVTDTDETGAYRINDLTAGQYTLVASGFPSAAAGLTLVGGRDDRQDVELGHWQDAQPPGLPGSNRKTGEQGRLSNAQRPIEGWPDLTGSTGDTSNGTLDAGTVVQQGPGDGGGQS